MNKTYEAPVAEIIKMQMPTVLMGTTTGNNGGFDSTGNDGQGGDFGD